MASTRAGETPRDQTPPATAPDCCSLQPAALPSVVNRLQFRTNSTTILPFLKSKADGTGGHPLFSLNSIASLPKALILPLNQVVVGLALQNIEIALVDESVKARFLADWRPDYRGKKTPQELEACIATRRQKLTRDQETTDVDTFEQAVSNYRTHGFFCQFDWCMEHWGTVGDIEDLVETTFRLPTACIEFTTRETPPLIALQQLANTFPSVLFILSYRLLTGGEWREVQFYPFPPFGY